MKKQNVVLLSTVASLTLVVLLISQANAIQQSPSSQHVIIISGYPRGFVPNQINIKVGDSLVFINQDDSGFYGYETHRVLSINSKTGQPNGYFDSGTLYLGDKYVIKFPKPGNYTYIEALDPTTSGQIIVTP
ncbi:MAG: hypothetical protein KGI27_04855 [Thaumarchaeota archaeon]|nr:hypothetical protein [Nitrososphaerota archaeon]